MVVMGKGPNSPGDAFFWCMYTFEAPIHCCSYGPSYTSYKYSELTPLIECIIP